MAPASIDPVQARALKRAAWAHYRAHGRHDLPWRTTTDPYRILVSEVMLQQTQVPRVRVAYPAFIARFPTVRALARAPLREVLVAWQGLGYNRRAKGLHDAARTILTSHAGRVPRTEAGLRALPGVGPYTAAAVCAFAYDMPVPMLETNIRTVLMHHLFPLRERVEDRELAEAARVVLDTKRPREWHWALMDYGAHLKRSGVRLNARSAAYVKQSPFRGSSREVRGALLSLLAEKREVHTRTLLSHVRASPERVRDALHSLVREGLVRKLGPARWGL